MPDTKVTCAHESFAQLKKELSEMFPIQSEFEIIHDEAPPGVYRFKVRFDANLTDPRLIIVKEGKPNLSPDLCSGEAPEVKITEWRFDAFYDNMTFGWIKADDQEPPRPTDDIAAFIRQLV
jgi:hypothetical protein